MLMIVALELGEQRRKIIVEHQVGDDVTWLLGYINNSDDVSGFENRLKDFRDLHSISFTNSGDAFKAFENYKV